MSSGHFWPPGALSAHTFEVPPFTVNPILPAGGIGVLHGPPGIGKSQVALTLGIAVASGTQFLVPEYTTTAGKVLYVQADVTPMVQQQRTRAAGSAADSIAFYTNDEFDVLTAAPTRTPQLAEAIRFGPALVIVDTLRNTNILDENDSATPGLVYGAWKRLFPGATIFLVHHDRKLQALDGPQPERFKQETYAGSRAWLAAADVGLHMHDWKQDLNISFSKTRTCPPQGPLSVKLHPSSLLVELAAPTARQKALSWLSTLKSPPPKADVVGWLLKERVCNKTYAYRLAEELLPSTLST